MKVFVAGATGVLGRAMVPRLVAAGHEVRALARSRDKAAQLETQGAEPVLGIDLLDATSVAETLRGAEAVIHAATSIPPAAKAWRSRSWMMNDRLRREGTANLVDAARAAGVTRFVKESVCFFYEPGGDRWITEDSPIETSQFAGATLDAERTVMAFDEGAGHTGVVLRFGLFYSADARALQEGLGTARLGYGPMVGRPDAYQPSIHVDDAATAVVAALDAPGGVYNVADDPITKQEWNDAFFEAFRLDKTSKPTPSVLVSALGEKGNVLAASRRVSSQRFREATGWNPKYADASVGIKAMAADHLGRTS